MTATIRSAGFSAPSPLRAITDIRLSPLVWLYLIAVVLPVGINLGPLAVTALRLFLMIVTIPLFVRLMTGEYGRVYWTDGLFAAHAFWMLVALTYNNPDQVIQQMGSVGVEFIGGYAVGRAGIRSPAAFLAMAKALTLIVLCLLPFSIFEALTGRPLIVEFLHKLPVLTSVEILSIYKRMGLERVQSAFAHPIHYGLFCSISFSLAFVALKGYSTLTWRYLSGAIIAFSGLLALSSGALLAILLQFALIMWATMFRRLEWRWWLLVGLFVLAYVVVDLLSNRTPLKVFMTYAVFSAHNAYWRSAIFEWGMVNVWSSPIFGIGLNDWVRPDWMHSSSVDNFWLLMAMRYGIPGFLLIAAGYLIGVARVMRRKFDGDATLLQIRRAWVFTMLGLSFTLCTVHVWTNIYSFVFFILGSGFWLLTAQPNVTDRGEAQVSPNDPGYCRDGGLPRYARSFAEGTSQPSERPAVAATGDAPTPPRFTRFAPGDRTDDGQHQ